MDVSENLVCSDFGSFPGFGWMNPALSPPICTTTTTFWSQRFWTSNTKPENNPKLDQNLWPRNSGRFNLQSDIAYVGSGRSFDVICAGSNWTAHQIQVWRRCAAKLAYFRHGNGEGTSEAWTVARTCQTTHRMTSKWKMVPLILDLEASQVFKTAFTSELPALQGKKSHIDNSLGSVLRLLYSFWYISGTTKALTSLAPLSWFVAPCTSAPFAASFQKKTLWEVLRRPSHSTTAIHTGIDKVQRSQGRRVENSSPPCKTATARHPR